MYLRPFLSSKASSRGRSNDIKINSNITDSIITKIIIVRQKISRMKNKTLKNPSINPCGIHSRFISPVCRIDRVGKSRQARDCHCSWVFKGESTGERKESISYNLLTYPILLIIFIFKDDC